MIEEKALVSSVEGDAIRVRAFGAASCPRCAAGQGCGGGVLARLLKRRDAEVVVAGRLDGLRIGDVVVVGLAESALLRASLWVYLLPVLAMFVAAAFAQTVLAVADAAVAAWGLAGLALGFGLTRRYAQAAPESDFRPQLLRRPSRMEMDACTPVQTR